MKFSQFVDPFPMVIIGGGVTVDYQFKDAISCSQVVKKCKV